MKKLENLSEIANSALGGLNATPGMKYQILQKAQQRKQRMKRLRMIVPAAATCAAALALVVVLQTGSMQKPETPIVAMKAGRSAPSAVETTVAEDAVPMMAILSAGEEADGSIWVESGETFPLIGMGGRYYRMLEETAAADRAELQPLGSVQEYTLEPALASGDVTVSNTVRMGESVYTLPGMENVMVFATTDGQLRAFQRISFAGSALLGSEQIANTLPAPEKVTALNVPGRGEITDPAVCRQLMQLLCDSAVYENAGTLSGSVSPVILSLENGQKLQLLLRDDRVCACGVWSCPEFTELLEAHLK